MVHGVECSNGRLFTTTAPWPGASRLTEWDTQTLRPIKSRLFPEIDTAARGFALTPGVGKNELWAWVGLESMQSMGIHNPLHFVNCNNFSEYGTFDVLADILGPCFGVRYAEGYIWATYCSYPQGRVLCIDPFKQRLVADLKTPMPYTNERPVISRDEQGVFGLISTLSCFQGERSSSYLYKFRMEQ